LKITQITVHQYDFLSRFRQFVNEASHAPVDSVNPDNAVEFAGLAVRFAASLDSEGI
jgi:hypothetical protein